MATSESADSLHNQSNNGYGIQHCLSGDDSGEATLEEVEEKFGGVEEVRGFVNAVRAQSEVIMIAVV